MTKVTGKKLIKKTGLSYDKLDWRYKQGLPPELILSEESFKGKSLQQLISAYS